MLLGKAIKLISNMDILLGQKGPNVDTFGPFFYSVRIQALLVSW